MCILSRSEDVDIDHCLEIVIRSFREYQFILDLDSMNEVSSSSLCALLSGGVQTVFRNLSSLCSC